QLASIIDNNDIDVIHSHYAIPHAVAAILAGNIARRKVRTVTTLHGTDITLIGSHPTFKNITKYAIEESDVVTAVSEFLKERTQEVLGINGDKIQVVYNFVDRQCSNPDLKCWCCHKPAPDKKIIAHASNLRPVKAPLDVIKLFAGISESTSFNTELWVIGDGPMQSEMIEFCRKLGIEKNVKFLGIRTDLGRILTCCDLFLLPSKEESFGLAALEAMACGVPVIASRSGGLPEVIDDGVSGCLIDVGDIEAGAEMGRRLLVDEDFAKLVIHGGLETAFNRFRQSNIVSRYEALYHVEEGAPVATG
ncbi:MAG TPA: N-acetyl-alpha-D-glucosaminyl L-malate synthase BshA, partial [Spirochaetales bacterium]|nr:N-acetyl-alpha-D-glucosaminyl L-malate synthase BshA [Spirochaetales bacterium]